MWFCSKGELSRKITRKVPIDTSYNSSNSTIVQKFTKIHYNNFYNSPNSRALHSSLRKQKPNPLAGSTLRTTQREMQHYTTSNKGSNQQVSSTVKRFSGQQFLSEEKQQNDLKVWSKFVGDLFCDCCVFPSIRV